MTKYFRKATALGLGIVAVCSLCGCSSTNTTETSTNQNPETEEAVSSSNTDTDSVPLSAVYKVNTDVSSLENPVSVSDTLYGLFLEDINFAVDGGLYAELIKNRSFEYGSAAANENMHGWTNENPGYVTFAVVDGNNTTPAGCLNENNPHYAVLSYNGLSSSDVYYGIGNAGYLDGLAVTGNETYNVSLYLRIATESDIDQIDADTYASGMRPLPDGTASIRLSLRDTDGTVYAQALIENITDTWTKYETTLTPTETVNKDLQLYVECSLSAVCLDMVSMMPADTYKGLPIRKDIGEFMEALNPSFLRFPGGCVIEGRDEESIYNWKDSVGNGLTFTVNGEEVTGDAATRPQGKDIWSGTKIDPYYTTYGIGFYEYFALCEALDCLPVPVLNAGMTCQVQSPRYIVYPLNSDEFKQYVQDALDLVEFCRGGADTAWGAVRIAMGHAEPFRLKYIGIGNEQWQSEYHAHYEKFVEAFENAAKENPELYSDIELIVANGTASGSTEGWSYIEDYPDSITTLVDEHYYESPNWFLTNTKRYDAYDRTAQAKVFLGEYAAQSNTLQAALAEAAYMTGLERNSDVVAMACYAPMFGNIKTNQWLPDMMFFSNNALYGTADYYVQKMFANHVGKTILPSELTVTGNAGETGLSGRVGLGSWMTSVSYDNLTVTSNADGSVLYSTDFEKEDTLKADGYTEHEGEWSIQDGKLVQEYTGDPFDANTGDVVYVGDTDWSNYTLTVDAEILSGNEGFLIPVCVKDTGNNIFWNIGGWGNTVSCLQIVSGNTKSGQITGTTKNLVLKKNQVYQLKVVVEDNNIKCYIDDTLYVDYTQEAPESIYETSSVDEDGNIILKFVNVTGEAIDIDVTLENIDMGDFNTTASVTVLNGENLSDVNSFEEPEKISLKEETAEVSENFTYTAPKYSVSIIVVLKK